jgi:copper chaperone
MKFHIPQMSCGHCTAAITKTVQAIDPAATITPDLTTREASITTTLPVDTVLAMLAGAGYPATVV